MLEPNTTPTPSQRMRRIQPTTHGGTAERRGFPFLDVSVNVNPYGPPPGLRDTIAAALTDSLLARYPDPEVTALRERLAAHLSISTSTLLVGNGSVELFQQIALAFLNPDDTAVVVGPAFGEYRIASHLAGAQVVEVRPVPDATAAWPTEALCAAVRSAQPQLVWLANPANPTGRLLPPATISALLDSFAGLLVLDEAFHSLADAPWESLPLCATGRVVVVRSLTKDFSLAGLRLGYLVAASPIVGVVRQARMPWSVNSLAQVAGVAALEHLAWLAECRTRLLTDRALLAEQVRHAGWSVVPSVTPFFIAQPPGAWTAQALTASLLTHAVAVRDCTSFGLPGYIRIASQRTADNARLAQVLMSLTREG